MDSYFINHPKKKEKIMPTQQLILDKQENIVTYEGRLSPKEGEAFLIDMSRLIIPTEKITISLQSCYSPDSCVISISSVFMDTAFSPNGAFAKLPWSKKFRRISGPSPRKNKAKTNSVTLPSNDVLSFRDERWWITRSRGGGIEECLRSEAHNLLRQNCLVNAVTDEAWADVIKPDQPLL